MINEQLITAGQEGLPLKKVLNFDEKTYSVATRPEYFPVQIKVPKNVIFEKIYLEGHPYFVDDKQHIWSGQGTSVYSKNLDTDDSVTFKNMLSVDPETRTIEYVCKTREDADGNYNILVSIARGVNTGGRIYLSKDKGETWAKVLDAEDFGLASLFRTSNFWYHKVGNTEYIIVGSYGTNNAENISANNKVWISKDKGETWTVIYEPPLIQSGTNNHIHSLCVAPHNGWLWITHGDGQNRGILYSHDALYAAKPTMTVLSEGAFFNGGWQASAVVTTILGAYFGTDTGNGLPNGVLGYDLPERTLIDKLGYKYQTLHDDDLVHISRRGAQINYCESYIPMHSAGRPETKIFVTGDAGFSWHEAISFPFGAFEKGMTNPDSQGFVYGAGTRFKVSEWETVTRWVKGRYAEKTNYI